jgi:hypothetical protein
MRAPCFHSRAHVRRSVPLGRARSTRALRKFRTYCSAISTTCYRPPVCSLMGPAAGACAMRLPGAVVALFWRRPRAPQARISLRILESCEPCGRPCFRRRTRNGRRGCEKGDRAADLITLHAKQSSSSDAPTLRQLRPGPWRPEFEWNCSQATLENHEDRSL